MRGARGRGHPRAWGTERAPGDGTWPTVRSVLGRTGSLATLLLAELVVAGYVLLAIWDRVVTADDAIAATGKGGPVGDGRAHRVGLRQRLWSRDDCCLGRGRSADRDPGEPLRSSEVVTPTPLHSAGSRAGRRRKGNRNVDRCCSCGALRSSAPASGGVNCLSQLP
jgi:hypothetical protein